MRMLGRRDGGRDRIDPARHGRRAMTEGESICEVVRRREGVYDLDQREAIVRCRDCRHFHRVAGYDVCDANTFRHKVPPDGYCWRGERA